MLFNDNRILFFDHENIESAENVSLTLNAPVKMGPCLVIEREWEMKGARAYCVVEYEGQYRLYYKVGTDDDEMRLACAVSGDGVTWERPDLGAVEFSGSTANNLCPIDGQRPNEVCVFVDPTGPDEHRFKCVAHSPAMGGMFLMTSPDGIRFKRVPGHLLKFIVDSNKSAFFDERIGKYVIYLRGWDRTRPIPPMEGTRSVLRAETDDLFRPIPIDEKAPNPWHLSPKWNDIIEGGLRRMNAELPTAMRCDDSDPPSAGLYQAAAVQYLPAVYLAFPSLYYHFPWPPEGLYINDGVLDLQFAASRDGVNWRRDLRGSYVRLDLPDGHCTKMMHMLTGMVPNGYRINQYYMGGRRTHGEGRTGKDVKVERPGPEIGSPIVHRLEQRMDGFVSADSAYTGGTLVTKQFTIESDKIRLNIDTSASGVAHAALLDEGGGAIPGFALEDSDRIQGNDTQCALSWRGNSDVTQLRGKRVKLMLRSRSTKLYAIYP